MDSIYSTKEAADKLKLSQAHIRRLLESGQLSGKRLGHDWIVFNLDYKRKRKAKRKKEKGQ
jgi:excisionase family DNA binding protein